VNKEHKYKNKLKCPECGKLVSPKCINAKETDEIEDHKAFGNADLYTCPECGYVDLAKGASWIVKL
jgi:predicted RNA-binding Zn-ribbon protein involved in translation (DUF1610 family)